jgi:hypothetical protein
LNYIEKKALRQRIISELRNRGYQDIEAILDSIDFDSLIDSQLSYEENLENVIREIGIFLSDNHYRNIREIERIANNMKIDLDNGIIIKYGDNPEEREYINLEDDSLMKIAEFYETQEKMRYSRTKPIVKPAITKADIAQIRKLIREKYPVCPICGTKYSHIYFKITSSNIYVYFEHAKVENGWQKKHRHYFRTLSYYIYGVPKAEKYPTPITIEQQKQVFPAVKPSRGWDYVVGK